MKDFKTFLYEQIVSRETALGKLKKIKPFFKDQISTKEVIPNVERKSQPEKMAKVYFASENPTPQVRKDMAAHVQRVPMDKIVTGQNAVSKTEVAKKIKGAKKNDPPVPFFIKTKEGKYHAIDGNHRTAGRKLRGFTHIRGVVFPEE